MSLGGDMFCVFSSSNFRRDVGFSKDPNVSKWAPKRIPAVDERVSHKDATPKDGMFCLGKKHPKVFFHQLHGGVFGRGFFFPKKKTNRSREDQQNKPKN